MHASLPTGRPPLEAPVDPRARWGLPDPGRLPIVTRLDELVVRILAPNASPMTLDGTNTYVIAAAGTGQAAVVDPGPMDATHLRRVREVLTDNDVECRWIVLTHAHADHAEAAASCAEMFDARIAAASPEAVGAHGLRVSSGDRLQVGATTLKVIATPGHSSDHLAFRLDNDSVLVGDHVLGRGTSVVAHPDGDLAAYLDSLRLLLRMGPAVLYPGHGPELREDPSSVLRYYLEHRRFREQQIIDVLTASPLGQTARDLVRRIYADVSEELRPAAEGSTRAALIRLRQGGVVDLDRDGVARLVSGSDLSRPPPSTERT